MIYLKKQFDKVRITTDSLPWHLIPSLSMPVSQQNHGWSREESSATAEISHDTEFSKITAYANIDCNTNISSEYILNNYNRPYSKGSYVNTVSISYSNTLSPQGLLFLKTEFMNWSK